MSAATLTESLHERGVFAELVTRIAEHRDRRRLAEPDLDLFYDLAGTAPLVEVVRMRNRLRDAFDGDETRRHPAQPHPPRVPRVELAEVWDAPVWTWWPVNQSAAHHVTAVAVSPRLYLETWQGGREAPRDRFGAQVIARAWTAGQEDVYAAFWRADGCQWRQVTGELSADDMTGWTGAPLPAHKRGRVARGLDGWLDTVAALETGP